MCRILHSKAQWSQDILARLAQGLQQESMFLCGAASHCVEMSATEL